MICLHIGSFLPSDFQSQVFAEIDSHDDVIKWKNLPCYWPVVLGIHRSPVISPHKGQWRGTLMFSLISAWIRSRANNGNACDLRRKCARYDVIVIWTIYPEILGWDKGWHWLFPQRSQICSCMRTIGSWNIWHHSHAYIYLYSWNNIYRGIFNNSTREITLDIFGVYNGFYRPAPCNV